MKSIVYDGRFRQLDVFPIKEVYGWKVKGKTIQLPVGDKVETLEIGDTLTRSKNGAYFITKGKKQNS